MYNKESVVRAIAEFMAMEFPYTINRDINIDLSTHKIIVLAGVRRAGKTYELFNITKSLLSQDIPRENILYINFEDERFLGFKATDFDFIIDTFYSLTTIDVTHKIYLFFDEIQNIEGWERAIRRLYDTNKFEIFLTGSSSKLLSAEISTALVGRNLTYVIYPFSFREFLLSRSFNPDRLSIYSELPQIKKYSLEYITYGGFPEITLTKNEDTKRRIISSYYDSILFNDISKRYAISNVNILKLVVGYAINSYSSPFSVSKLYNYLKSIHIEISKKTVNNYINYAESVFFLFMNMKFSASYKKMHQSRKKAYLIDNGFTLLYKKSDDMGKLLENAVYIELLRRKEKTPGIDIFYFGEDSEIDFIITRNNSVTQAIQVCYNLNASNINREVKPLTKFIDTYNIKEGLIIVMEMADDEINDNRIKIVNFYEWALSLNENVE
ncbi:ATP-binding protein [Ferroplasma sp.]|uniref:ATP-binding protein n=1 Tax=Ferroplasma sp. TaxID=2591003 RepID=UPI002610C170|nr:ATP-binding protein [Ferroplasma sp.]